MRGLRTYSLEGVERICMIVLGRSVTSSCYCAIIEKERASEQAGSDIPWHLSWLQSPSTMAINIRAASP